MVQKILPSKLRDSVLSSLEELKAISPVTINVKKLTTVTDYIMIASGSSNRHIQSLGDKVLKDLKDKILNVEESIPTVPEVKYYDKDVKGESANFVWLNRGKESLVADIKNKEDQLLIQKIISKADVYIQNLVPGAAERAKLGSKDLRIINDKLITCDISGYGQTGPYSQRKAYDLLVQAESGLCSITGNPDSPGRVGVSVCDIACGLNAHSAILQALLVREKTGKGCGIEISLFDGMADWMNVPYLQSVYGGRSINRVGLSCLLYTSPSPRDQRGSGIRGCGW